MRAEAALLAYRGAWRVAGPWLARRAEGRLREQGVAEARLGERRGHATLPRPTGPLAWFHAASVGEGLTVLPLLPRLPATCLVTTVTASSAALLARRLPPGALHQFAPLDAGPAARRFLDHWRPDLLVMVESELWPTLIEEAHGRGVPLALLNARLSARSQRRWRRMAPVARRLLGRLAMTVAQTRDAADALASLGADPVRVGGNLKAAAGAPPCDEAELARLRAALGDRPLWVAASTHPGEEEAVLDAHLALLAGRPDALLILAPRHPERGDAVAALIAARGLPFGRRSRGENPGAVLLADTLGETGLWFRLSPVAFLGGSFVPVGGHNPWEPAACGAATLSGPLVANAADDFAALIAAGAAAFVEPATLAATVAALWSDAPRLAAMRAAATGAVGDGAAALDAVAADLARLLRCA